VSGRVLSLESLQEGQHVNACEPRALITTGQKKQGTLITYTPCNIAVAWSPIILRLSSLSDGSRRHSLGRRGIFTLGEKLGVQYVHQEKWTRLDDAGVAEAQRSALNVQP
jgi:hypothetical protein